MTRRGRSLSCADAAGMGAVAAWLAWVLFMPLWTGRATPVDSPYVAAPLLLVGGVVAGRLLAPLSRRWRVAEVVLLAAFTFLVASDLYANAQGAFGVQLVALTGLMLLTGLAGRREGRQAVHLFAVGMAVIVIGVLLAARSDAAAILVLPTAILTALALGHRGGPPRGLTALASTAMLALATTTVGWLATLTVWPERLQAARSLSQARHTLWGDALDLWRQHPVTGAGPGSFREHSELAAWRPDLETVHSSVLQVGSELGLVGVLLFAAMLLAGLAIAGQGNRAASLIGMVAWTALGVHSVIDHLYEFPVVTLTAGVVLGWASSAPNRRQG